MSLLGRITADESLFWYDEDESYDDFQDHKWTPYFSNDITSSMLPSDADEVCGASKECRRVYFVTKNPVAAQSTLETSQAAWNMASFLC